MTIAFAYADTLDKLTPIYRGLAEGLIKNIQLVMPQEKILHIGDDDTQPFTGSDILRVPRKVGLMSWRLIAHHCAHSVADEILFTEPDVRFTWNVMEVFEQPFDVTVTKRVGKTSLKGEVISAPYTFGANFSRSADFWKDAAKRCLKYGAEEQTWGGDMTAVQETVDSGVYSVLVIDDTYNHVPATRDDIDAKANHYKGKRKTWLFPYIAEAA